MRVGRSGVPWLLALAACEDGGYDLVVHVPDDASRAAVVEVAVLGSCSEVQDPGEAADAPIRTVAVSGARSEPIGWLAEGSYGLHGRAWDSDCFLYAGGCSPARIEDGGSGTLDVFLAALPPRGCDDDETCSGGRCLPPDTATDGGPEPDVDAGLDAEVDGG